MEWSEQGGAGADGAVRAVLAPDEAQPFVIENAEAASDFLIAVEHAGMLLPRALGDLGLDSFTLHSHVAVDIGIAPLARSLSRRLDALLVMQPYSRLVVDCNRPYEADDLVVARSDGVAVPGNSHLTTAERQRRIAAVHIPFHRQLEALIDRRMKSDRRPVLIDLHSFTPVFNGQGRPWHICFLFNRDQRLAQSVSRFLSQRLPLRIGFNEPYNLDDLNDYTIPVHAERRGLPSVQIEIRQDLLASCELVALWTDALACCFEQALAELGD